MKEVSDRLAGSVRREDTVARFGGDEFLVVCENVNRENALGIVVQLELYYQPILLIERDAIVGAEALLR